MFNKYGVDGIMIGRAAIGNPWIFNDIKDYMYKGQSNPAPALKERISVCLSHLELAIQKKGSHKGIIEMRKHYAGYFKGLPGFKKVRMDILTQNSFAEIEKILNRLEIPE
jgi:tRNA-dihydrouridine synthase